MRNYTFLVKFKTGVLVTEYAGTFFLAVILATAKQILAGNDISLSSVKNCDTGEVIDLAKRGLLLLQTTN